MFKEILDQIHLIEDDLSMLGSSSMLVYDNKFHAQIVKSINEVIDRIFSDDNMTDADKILLLSLLVEVQKNVYEDLNRSVSRTDSK